MVVKVRFTLAAILFMAVGTLVPTPAAAASGPPTLVASGFDSPRGVAFFKGKLVVGEAGHGGTNCIPASGQNPLTCFGRTSQISWVNTVTGAHSTLLHHLSSLPQFHYPCP